VKRRGESARAGMTLLELLLVLSLLALILGGGLGLFAALDLGKRQAAGLVRNIVRSAENTAIARNSPARVRIDRQAGTIRAESLLIVGTYHFEGQAIAGYGPEGRADPELFSDEGFMGAAFHPAGRIGATAEIPVTHDPAFDFTRGFAIECAIFREQETNGRLFSLGASEPPTLALEVNRAGALRGRFRTRLGDEFSQKAGGQAVIESESGLIPLGRWTQVRMQYDRESFALLVDGAPVSSQEEHSFVWKTDGPLLLSDRTLPFPGKIDSLVIGALIAGEPGVLPRSVHFAPESPARIEFEAGGALNRRLHADPPRIVLEYEDGARDTVVVGFYGTVE